MRTQSTTPDNRLDEESKERVKGNFWISRRYIKKLFKLETTT